MSLARCEQKPKESHHPGRPRRVRQAMVLEMAQEPSRDGIRPGPRTPANTDVKRRIIEHHLARSTHILADTSSPRSASLNRRVRSQSFLRKSQPQFTGILAARQHLVGLDNGITGLKEARPALLQLQSIEHKPHRSYRVSAQVDLPRLPKASSGNGRSHRGYCRLRGEGVRRASRRNRASRTVAGKRPRPHQSHELPSTQICRVSCTRIDRSRRRSKIRCGTSLCTWGLQENKGSAECLWLGWQPKRPWDSQSKEPCCDW